MSSAAQHGSFAFEVQIYEFSCASLLQLPDVLLLCADLNFFEMAVYFAFCREANGELNAERRLVC
jgi:hypothetical protein